MAAFSAVLLIGFELVLTHWSYLYVPWFFPFVAMALIAPLAGGAAEAAEPELEPIPPPPIEPQDDAEPAPALA
jgi:hypothetical protein